LLIRFIIILCLFVTINTAQHNVAVEKIDKSSLQELIDNREDKVLLLNIWATWCPPCIKEIPDLIRISNNYKSIVDVVGISIDFSEDLDKKVLPFLEKNNVSYINYINGFRKDEDLINFFIKNWSGALPASFIYNRNGDLLHFIEGKKDYDYFRKMIEKIDTD
jgi:thiol-disulfide isomerase/thioredoxin